MSSEKIKSESYQNLGGINLKASPYLTRPQEFLNLVNFDFQTPGSLTKRWGSTQYLTQSYTGQIQSLFEYSKLDGSSALVIGVSGGLWYGATSGQLQGVSFAYTGATAFYGTTLNGGTYFSQIHGFFYYNTVGGQPTLDTGGEAIYIDGSVDPIYSSRIGGAGASYPIYQWPSPQKQNNFSFVTINNVLFGADGSNFFKYDGVTTSYYGIPPVLGAYIQNTNPNDGGTVLTQGFDYVFACSYVNRRGFEGPVTALGILNQYVDGGGATLQTNTSLINGIPVPNGFDISGVKQYISVAAGSSAFIAIRDGRVGQATIFNRTFYEIKTVAVTPGNNWVNVDFGVVGGASAIPAFPTWLPKGYQFRGVTYSKKTVGISLPFTLSSTFFAPKYLEVYNNQLMMAGITGMASTVVFSEVGEPEASLPENFFEVRTNDGDMITGMKSYQSAMMIFKQNSYHQLTGDDPTNFTLRQVSDQYGCVNNRCSAVYEDFLVFLDRKGIIRHNGANQETISPKIQDVFDSMNYSAAQTVACMAHDKKRNQILTAIPINGATFNNVTVVYDYLTNSWTKQEGYNPALFAVMTGNLGVRAIFYGGITGNIYNFGASYFGDNGTGFTCLMKTRYLSELGHSIEKQYRRLYVDADPVTGSTSVFNLKMLPGFGSTVGFTGTMVANPFQTRIDFGISSKSMAFELSNFSSSDSVKIHGYVLEYRHQRNV